MCYLHVSLPVYHVGLTGAVFDMEPSIHVQQGLLVAELAGGLVVLVVDARGGLTQVRVGQDGWVSVTAMAAINKYLKLTTDTKI